MTSKHETLFLFSTNEDGTFWWAKTSLANQEAANVLDLLESVKSRDEAEHEGNPEMEQQLANSLYDYLRHAKDFVYLCEPWLPALETCIDKKTAAEKWTLSPTMYESTLDVDFSDRSMVVFIASFY